MTPLEDLTPGATLSGLVPGQSVEVVSVRWFGDAAIELTFKRADGAADNQLLYRADEARLTLAEPAARWSFDAPGDAFRLASEARRIALASLFDVRLAVHTSLVEPLPHQILAVYERMLPRQPLRFLLADDPGAGKTVMAGLLIKELVARGDLERCLIVVPGSLAEQWQDELSSKFQLDFAIATTEALAAARNTNWFLEHPRCIARLDKLSRDEDAQARALEPDWDLVVVDEAHKMSASFFGKEVRYTKRHQLGRRLAEATRHFLLMSATPHNGKQEDFELFLALLDPDRFEGRAGDTGSSESPGSSAAPGHGDLMRRMVKEQLRRFDGRPLFPERRAYTVPFSFGEEEASLYSEVTGYVREEFNRAEDLEDGRRRTVGFALTVLQRRLASSPAAIHASLRRRRERLEERVRDEQGLVRGDGRDAELDVLEADDDEVTPEELEAAEDAVADAATAARTVAELRLEIDTLARLEAAAARLTHSGRDRKWTELSTLLQECPEMRDADGRRRKIIVFTEHRDTLEYLRTRIGTLLGRPDAIVTIAGGMNRQRRHAAEEAFRHDPAVEVLLATDAAGEGINLQRASLMVNYDLPWNPNRLEQRFGRIHRIGQTEVCHCWNLVAHETREGDVYRRLLEKLEVQRKALGGVESVFDVLGDVFAGSSLRKLLIEAVRYGQRPEVRARLHEKLDDATDPRRLRALLDRDALARDTLDTTRVEELREEMARAEATRLQPHYIYAFFAEAFARAGGRMTEREPGRYEVTRVPAALREPPPAADPTRSDGGRPRGRAPVLPRYERVAFEKHRVLLDGQPPAALLAPGHPLLDRLIAHTLERLGHALERGSLLIDPQEDPGGGSGGGGVRVLFAIDQKIRDATRRVVAREFVHLEFDAAGQPRPAGAAPYLDHRPASPEERAALSPLLRNPPPTAISGEDAATAYAVQRLVPAAMERLRGVRSAQIERTRHAVQARLTREITHWDHQASELLAQEEAGKTPRIASARARRRADELAERLARRMERLARESSLSPAAPVVTGAALIVPESLVRGLLAGAAADPPPEAAEPPGPDLRDRVDRLAVDAVLAAERALGREPREMEHQNPGYDVESRDPAEPGRLRFLEVKGRARGRDEVTVSATQIRTCCNAPADWILAVVVVDPVAGTAEEPAYLPGHFQRPPSFDTVKVTLRLADLLKQAKPPH